MTVEVLYSCDHPSICHHRYSCWVYGCGRIIEMATSLATEEARKLPNPPLRRHVWSQYIDTGFSCRVNHATSMIQCGGNNYLYSVGGYHEDDTNRILAAKKKVYFKTGPIDMQCLDIGKPYLLKHQEPMNLMSIILYAYYTCTCSGWDNCDCCWKSTRDNLKCFLNSYYNYSTFWYNLIICRAWIFMESHASTRPGIKYDTVLILSCMCESWITCIHAQLDSNFW